MTDEPKTLQSQLDSMRANLEEDKRKEVEAELRDFALVESCCPYHMDAWDWDSLLGLVSNLTEGRRIDSFSLLGKASATAPWRFLLYVDSADGMGVDEHVLESREGEDGLEWSEDLGQEEEWIQIC